MRILINNVRLADPSGLHEARNVFISNGQIEGFNLGGGADLELDGSKFVLAPAFTDPHAHLREPGQEVKEDLQSGLGAAVAGGFGTVVSMPNTSPAVDDPGIVSSLIEKAERLGQLECR